MNLSEQSIDWQNRLGACQSSAELNKVSAEISSEMWKMKKELSTGIITEVENNLKDHPLWNGKTNPFDELLTQANSMKIALS